MMTMEMPPDNVWSKVYDQVDTNGKEELSLLDVQTAVHILFPTFDNDFVTETAFDATDVNGDNTIQRNEFPFLLRFIINYNNQFIACGSSNGTSPTEDENFNSRSSTKKVDCHLSQSDLYDMVERKEIILPTTTDLDDIFHKIDTNERGYISLSELCTWITVRQTKKTTSPGGSYRFANSTSANLLATALGSYGDTNYSYISTFFIRLRCSIDVLKGKASDDMIEKWALIAHECMGLESRYFLNNHNQHLEYDMADPIQMIALMFHELVYYEVDKVAPCLVELLEGVYEEDQDGSIRITCHESSIARPHIAMVLKVFDLNPGDTVSPRRPFSCFLSSVVTVQLLKEALPMKTLVKIVTCIFGSRLPNQFEGNEVARFHLNCELENEEQSILYDKLDHGASKDQLLNDLYDRLRSINSSHQLKMSEGKLVKAVQRAVDTCNRILGCFLSDRPDLLISRAWDVLPQYSPALRRRKLFTAFDYYKGLINFARFFDTVTPERLTMSFRGVPTEPEIATFMTNADANLKITRVYVKAQHLSLAIVVAFAKLTGGDAPNSFFIGDAVVAETAKRRTSDQLGDGLPVDEGVARRTSDQLFDGMPNIERRGSNISTTSVHSDDSWLASDCNMYLYDMLSRWHPINSWYGRKSPIGAFVYAKLGDKRLNEALDHTSFPMEDDQAEALLSTLPIDLIVPIGKNIAKIAVCRCKSIEELLGKLLQKSNAGTVNGDEQEQEPG